MKTWPWKPKNIWKLYNVYIYPSVISAGVVSKNFFKYLENLGIIIIIIIIIIVIIIIILRISFMQGIYTYIPEANHIPREHCVATILM